MKHCKTCKTQIPDSHPKSRCDPCSDHWRKLQLRRQYIYKAWVYSKLGGKCEMCGISDYRVLSIDHIKRDAGDDPNAWECGNQTRDSRWYMKIWKHIAENKRYPHDLQLLCMNCHMIKDTYFHKTFETYCEERVHPLLMCDFKQSRKKHDGT